MVGELIAHVVGARPNFVKLAALYPSLEKFNQLIVHTGQHYDYELSKVFFEEFNIPEPDYNLEVGSGTHGYQTGEMLRRCEEILIKTEPRLVIVYGDTNSTLAGALATVKLGIPIAHVEAGLRCGLRYMSEEVNRILVDHASELLFAPTQRAVENLAKEGITNGVYFVGDVMLDLFLKFKDRFTHHANEKFVLLTLHRAENVDNPKRLANILEALQESDVSVVFPIHPRTKKRIDEFNLTHILRSNKVKLLEPQSYLRFLELMSKSEAVITDSGGVQKEAYFMEKPCITLREATEWVETVEAGWNILVGADREKIIEAVKSFHPTGKPELKVFGDGKAALKIASVLSEYFEGSTIRPI